MGTRITSLANNFDSTGKLKAAGINNASLSSITSLPSGVAGNQILLSTQTASGDSSISFTSGIDSTYEIYRFKFIDINPVNDLDEFNFNLSTDGGSNYDVSKSSTYFWSEEIETDGADQIQYRTGQDSATTTSDINVIGDMGNGADESGAGELLLYNPSATTYQKHFLSRTHYYHGSNYSIDNYMSGIGITASAINAIIFRFAGGNFDGTIKMYGIKAS